MREPGAETRTEGWAETPVLLHVGLHKTATTWLQSHIFTPKDGREIIYCGDPAASHAAFIRPAWGAFRVEDALARLRPWLDRARSSGLPLVISDEALGGYPFHHKYFREVNASRLASAFPQAKVLVTVREQVSIIHSMYGQYLRYGNSSSVGDFLADPQSEVFHPILDRDYYKYDALLDFYEGVFGAGAVLAAPMEWMVRNPPEATARLGDFIGAPISPCSESLAEVRTYPAWSEAALGVLRVLNRFVPRDSRFLIAQRRGRIGRRLSPDSLAYRIDRLARLFGLEGRGARRRELTKRRLQGYYARSNARFEERCGFRISDYGYL